MPEIILIEATKTKRGNVAILLRPTITRRVGRYVVAHDLYDDTPEHLEWHGGEHCATLGEAYELYKEIIRGEEYC